MPGAAYIISWNVWQMDGLIYGLPGHTPKELSSEEKKRIIQDFEKKKSDLGGINLQKSTLRNIDFHDKSAIKQTFESLVNKNNNK